MVAFTGFVLVYPLWGKLFCGDSLISRYRVPPPKESIIGLGESPLVEEHTGWASRCYNSCVISGGIVVMPVSNDGALLRDGAGGDYKARAFLASLRVISTASRTA